MKKVTGFLFLDIATLQETNLRIFWKIEKKIGRLN